MAVITQENDHGHLERKSNKRKTRDALGENGSIQIDDERHKKKKKEILADQNVTESKREKNKKKNKTGDEGKASKAENISEIESIEDMNKKKKKKKKEDEVNGNKREKQKKNNGSGGKEEALLVYEEAEPVEVGKRGKKKEAENEVSDSKREKTKKKQKNKSRDEGGVSQAEEDVFKESEPMKERKKKKKVADESKAGYCVEEDRTVLVENQNEETKSVKSKKKRKKKKDDLGVGSLDEEPVSSRDVPSIGNEKRSRDRSSKKKKKINGPNTEGEGKACLKTSKRKNHIESSEKSTTPSKKSKVVRFSDQVEFLSLDDNSGGTEKLKDHRKGKKKVGRLKQGKVPSEENNQTKTDDDGLIRGVRFSEEEDEILKNSVLNYVEKYQLGEMGVEMVMKSSQYPEVKLPWKEIAEALPRRPILSVYDRAHILFERSENRAWTPEEIEQLKELYKKHGPEWRKIGDEMGKHRYHVKDAWRRIRYTDMKKGQWSQEEYGTLFELVNTDLRLKAFQEKKSQHGMLRDNICWEAIGEKLSTRGNSLCCQKWYAKLTSPMVKEGIWADADDYRLIIALEELDAACIDDVDWDNLLEHREGDVCRMRWNQMVRYIGEHGTKSFAEQVEILSQRYCPDLLEDRVAWDSKAYVDL